MHRKRSAIGIDIGDHAVKCVQLESEQGQLRVRDVCHVAVEGGGEDRMERRQRILESARHALRIGDFRGKKCLSSLRLFETTTRHVRIPAVDAWQAEEVLGRELRENGSETNGSHSCQFQQVAELLDHGERQSEFLCCIADPLVIREHLDLLSALGLRPVAIDLDACAQVRPFAGRAAEDEDSISLCVDLGCRCTRLILVRESRPILMRTVPVGGADFLQTLEKKLQLDFATARDLAEANRDGTSEELDDLKLAISRTLSEQLDLIVNRVLECARYAATLFAGRAVESLRALGGAAALPGVVEYLAHNLGIRVANDDPFRALGLESPRAARSVAPATFATAVGLALRGLES
jgi:type IV pilus assembly protein PilM